MIRLQVHHPSDHTIIVGYVEMDSVDASAIVALAREDDDIPTQHQSVPVDEQSESGWFADYVTVSRDFARAIAQRDEWKAKWQASNAETLRLAAEVEALKGRKVVLGTIPIPALYCAGEACAFNAGIIAAIERIRAAGIAVEGES